MAVEDDEAPNFEGHEPRECGEHRTLGSHRAWCFQCSEYCYPRLDAACHGCRAPRVEAVLDAARVIKRAHDRAVGVPCTCQICTTLTALDGESDES